MGANILVATPQAAFGELLRLSLEENGYYSVRLVQTGREALAAAGRLHYDLAILDAGLPDQPFIPLAELLRKNSAGLRLIVISPPNKSQSYNGLNPEAVFNQPFYMPDLLETVAGLVSQAGRLTPRLVDARVLQAPAAKVEELVARLGQLLAPANNQVLGAVILHHRSTFAATGRLEKAAQDELVATFNRLWKEETPANLARYLRPASGREILLYGAPLRPGWVLLLACEASMLITRARSLASKMAHALGDLIPETPALPRANAAPSETIPTQASPSFAPPAPQAAPEELSSSPAPISAEAQDLLDALEKASRSDTGEVESPGGAEPALEVSLSDLLAAMPSPDPNPPASANPAEWVPASVGEKQNTGFLFPWEMESSAAQPAPPAQAAPPPGAPAFPLAASEPSPNTEATVRIVRRIEQPVFQPPSALAASMEPTQRIAARRLAPLPGTASETTATISETRPNPLTAQARSQDDELTNQDFPGLAYTCILVPRLPHHQLQGPLAEAISDWLPQICLAYGWQIAWQAVQPDCFEWAVRVSPSISPGIVVRLIRQLTSERIFERYAQLGSENPSGDFWAPGYLIISGALPPEPNLIANYILQTRRRQGLA